MSNVFHFIGVGISYVSSCCVVILSSGFSQCWLIPADSPVLWGFGINVLLGRFSCQGPRGHRNLSESMKFKPSKENQGDRKMQCDCDNTQLATF